eukprot:TRINITY_DN13088_c0_g1_i1.p1 TRINITY_DN13088_c0_g1~~TRINITY_DN13088_c0_g1_i1.p1  ORF type:complete len:423 (+),score=182.76 TRINITY_DN13088_c0_g1_i1:70-1338(+)
MSFVEYDETCEFPIQNLPYGVFIHPEENAPHIGVAIGDLVLDLNILSSETEWFSGDNMKDKECFKQTTLNCFMSQGKATWDEAREYITKVLSADEAFLRDNEDLRNRVLLKQSDVQMVLPAKVGDYTDFYSSREHATNVGTMFRGIENALMPNWLHLPVGYHGRASSVVITGTEIHRPCGQLKPAEGNPYFAPCKLLDFELEMGFFVGPSNDLGKRIKIENSDDHIFGLVLMNDWSARDIQKWEYVPLGPFCGKNFATTISPWVVTMAALEPFRIQGPEFTTDDDPEILDYLKDDKPGHYDINLEVAIQAENDDELVICNSNLRNMYWSMKQQLTHHSSTGCNMQPGDLMGSGTISGKNQENFGSLLEITWRGSKPFNLPNGEERKFIQDNDTIILRGFCQGEGYRVGFGQASGKILPALED